MSHRIRNLRVLHISPWYEPAWAAGGTAIAVASLCAELANQGVEVHVFTTNDAGGGQALDVPTGIETDVNGVWVTYFHCGLVGKRKAAAYSRSLAARLQKEQTHFDILHISSTRHYHALVAYRWCKTTNTPYVITPHGSLMQSWIDSIGNPFLKIAYMKIIDNKIIRNAAAIHFLSDGERKESRKYSQDRESFVIPNGIAKSYYLYDSVRPPYLTSDKKSVVKLLYVGRIHPQKNLLLILKALKAIASDHLTLDVIGRVDDEDYYRHISREIADSILSETVQFHGVVARRQMESWYRSSDMLVMPSKVEGVSMAIIEALASSLPVLVTKHVANWPDIRDDNAGLVVEPRVENIVDVLRQILDGSIIIERMKQNAYRSALKRYDLAKVGKMMVRAYEDILLNSRSEELNWSV